MEKTNKQNKNTEHNVMTGLYPDKRGFTPRRHAVNGGIIFGNGDIAYNENRQTVRLEVRNTGDRPIQVGSHFHFFEVNRYLQFDRDAAFGCHLNIPATTAVRFEPGDTKTVELVTFAGKRRIIGFNNLVMGYTGDEDAPGYFPARTKAFMRVRRAGFKIAGEQSQSANAVYASDTAQAAQTAQTDIRHDENHARTEYHARAAAPKTKKTSSARGRKRKNE